MTDRAGAGPRAQGRVGTVINGKWRIDARIGAGGMATVYAATHRNGSRVALKMLHTPLSKDAGTKARFLREGYVANTVAHPGVVAVLDDGVSEDGAAYLVLELLEGETAEARRERLGGKLSLADALEIADQALAALAAAHEKGIVHRDVKPDNVFLTVDGRVKLLDFGLARMRDETTEATRTGVTIGTPEFMPPEQAVGKRGAVDARSDVWGLGATLFTLVTGEYLHHANTLHEQLLANATHRARPIRSLARHVPHAVAQVIDRALELEKEHRWPSAREMQDAFRRARGGAPVYADVGEASPEEAGDRVVVSSSAASSDPTMAMSRKPPSSEETLQQKAPPSRGKPPSSEETMRRDVVPVTHDVPHENDEVEETVPVSVDELRAAQRRANAAKAQVPPPPSTDVDLPPVTPPVSTPPVTARLGTSAPEGVPALLPQGGTAAMPPITPGGGVRAAPPQFATFGETVPLVIGAGSSARPPAGALHQPQTVSMAGPMTPRSAAGPLPSHAPHASANPYLATPPRPAPPFPRDPHASRTGPSTTAPIVKRATWPLWLLAFALFALAAAWGVLRAGLVHLP